MVEVYEYEVLDCEDELLRARHFRSIWYEIKRYFRFPRCLLGHEFSSTEVGTDGVMFEYYCARCQKKIKSEPIEGSLGFKRFKKFLDEEGIDLDLPVQHHRGREEDGDISP